MASQFLDACDAPFVEDKQTYLRWVRYWTRLAADGCSVRGAPTAPPESPDFLDALLQSQRGNYLLFDGGRVEDRVRRGSAKAACKVIFRELVARDVPGQRHDAESKERLHAKSEQLFDDAGISSRDDFIRSMPFACDVEGVHERFVFSYAVANGHPRALFHRVAIASPQSVFGTAFMFEWAKRAAEQVLLASLIYDDGTEGAKAERHAQTLSRFSKVINLADLPTAVAAVERIVESG